MSEFFMFLLRLVTSPLIFLVSIVITALFILVLAILMLLIVSISVLCLSLPAILTAGFVAGNFKAIKESPLSKALVLAKKYNGTK